MTSPTKRKAMALLVILGFTSSTASRLTFPARAAEAAHAETSLTQVASVDPSAPEINADWVEQRMREWQPSADERKFDEIGWAKSVGEALRLARENGRPVFLFTHDGRMGVGRC